MSCWCLVGIFLESCWCHRIFYPKIFFNSFFLANTKNLGILCCKRDPSKLGPKSWSYRASAFLKFNNACNLSVLNRKSGRFCLSFSCIALPMRLQGLQISPLFCNRELHCVRDVSES